MTCCEKGPKYSPMSAGDAEFVESPVKDHLLVKIQQSGSVLADTSNIVRNNEDG